MSLAVVAPQSIPQLERFVSEAFGAIPNRNVNPPEEKWAFQIPPYGKPGLVTAQKSIVEIVPIQELRQVTITWPIVFSSKEEREAFRLNKVCVSIRSCNEGSTYCNCLILFLLVSSPSRTTL